MKLLLTGASGFVGRNVLRRPPSDWRIVALYSSDATFPAFVDTLPGDTVVAVRCDLGNPADVAALVQEHGAQWDACLYLAGRVDIPWSVRAPKEDLLANTAPVITLLERICVDKFVYFSSGAVYDGLRGEVTPEMAVSPTLPYAISKLASEHYVAFHGRRRGSIGGYMVVRFFGAYGPHEAPHKIYTRLVRAFAVEKVRRYTVYGDGTNLIDAMFIDDAVDGIQRILNGSHWNRTVNLAGGSPVTVETLVREVAIALGLPSVEIEKQGAANEKNDFWGSVVDMDHLYGFRPRTPLTEGIARFRDFLLGVEHVR